MTGLIDGHNIEAGTMPLDRLAESVAADGDIDALDAKINTEIQDRIDGDSDLQDAIDNCDTKYVSKAGGVSETVTGEKVFTDSATFGDDVTIQGDLTVVGSSTTVESQDLTVTDNIVMFNNGESSDHVSAGISGFAIDRGTGANYRVLFDDATDILKAGFEGSEAELATVAYVDTEIANHPAVTSEVILTTADNITAQTNVLTTVSNVTAQTQTVTLGALEPGVANIYTVTFLNGVMLDIHVDPGSTGLTIKYVDNTLPTPVQGSVYILTVIVTGNIAVATGCIAA